MYVSECAGTTRRGGCGEQTVDYDRLTIIAHRAAARFVVDSQCATCNRITTTVVHPELLDTLISLGATRVDIGSAPDDVNHKSQLLGLQACDKAGVETQILQLGSVRDVGQLERGFPF